MHINDIGPSRYIECTYWLLRGSSRTSVTMGRSSAAEAGTQWNSLNRHIGESTMATGMTFFGLCICIEQSAQQLLELESQSTGQSLNIHIRTPDCVRS